MNNLTKSLWNAAPLFVILLLGLVIVLFVTQLDYVSDPAEDVKLASQDDRVVQMRSVLPRDAIQSVDTPRFTSADRADYAPDELVIGIEYLGQARAYSIPYLSKHEIVNDDIRGLRLAVTWCPLCFTAIVFEREIDGTVYEFGVSGRLIMNTLVMYDRTTESYWSQMLGEAVEGPLAGTRLTIYPYVWQTTWAEWLERFPDTVALDKTGPVGGSLDSYASYYTSEQTGIHPQVVEDNRLGNKDWIIGMEWDGEAVAYDFDTLSAQPVVNDTLGDLRTAIVFFPESSTGIVFDRTVDGQVLNFSFVDGVLTDAETRSSWDAWMGTATSGPLTGQRLRRVASTRAFWFAWSDYFPETRIYGQG